MGTEKSWQKKFTDVDPLDFSPGLLRIQAQPPTPFARGLMYSLFVLFGLLLVWAVFGRLDVVATAEGKLIPETYLKIVQPFEQGMIRDILVEEGQHVKEGQVLMRLDTTMSDADGRAINADYVGKRIDLRRIDAELNDRTDFRRQAGDPKDIYDEVLAQFRANRLAYQSALAEEQGNRDKAASDLAAAQEARSKLMQILPHYRDQAHAYEDLAKEGYVSRLAATDKTRERIEKEQDLKSQEYLIQSAQATFALTNRKLEQITAEYRQRLQAERADISDKLDRTQAEYTKQQYRHELLELKASQDGVIKDVATHTIGSVISPGTILMTLVPLDEVLRAEVWVSNQDVGFIHMGQTSKIKFVAYQFQKYGMLDGEVAHLSADASDNNQQGGSQTAQSGNKNGSSQPFSYRALIDLAAQELKVDGVRHALAPGMQVTAEIHLGTRSILEYLLSPVQGAFQEAARER